MAGFTGRVLDDIHVARFRQGLQLIVHGVLHKRRALKDCTKNMYTKILMYVFDYL